MLNVNRSLMVERASSTAPEEGSLIDLSHLTAIGRRRWKSIAIATAICVALGVLYLARATPMFTAEAEIIIDTTTSQAMQRQDMTDAGQMDTSLVDSQVEIITSEDLAAKVVRKLKLASDPEFVGTAPGPIGAATGAIGGAVQGLVRLVAGGSPSPSAGAGGDTSERRAVEVFSNRLSVKRAGLTYVIGISFTSADRSKAALIANETAAAYIQSVLDAKYAATRRTGDWLEGRLSQIRKQANDADRALQEFKSTHNIVDTNRGLMSEQQLADLNASLATAKAQLAEASARLTRAREVGNDPLGAGTISDAISNPVISRLRAQYLDLSNKANDLAARYGANHRAVLDLRAQMNQIRSSVQDEVRHITEGYESDYKIAEARQASLQASLSQMVTQSDTSSLDKVKLQDLESTADSFRALYNGYLQRFQEATQRESFPIADARIIDEATPPLQKSSPKSMMVLAASLALGLMLGVGSALARELADSFASPADVEKQTGLPCLGVLPVVASPRTGGSNLRTASPGDARPYQRATDSVVLDAPFSRYAETIRNVKISLDSIVGDRGAPVVAVTSSVPDEGKTTVALNLAHMMANAGNRVLLIDGDLSNRRLTERAARGVKGGLLEALADPDSLPALVYRDDRSRLDILACAADRPIHHRAEILASDAMARLLGRAREAYQYVVIDLAPVVPVVDAKAIARMVDCFVMVIEWRETSRKVVAEALSNEAIHQRTLGAVLNKVDPRALAQMEAYKGKAFNNYYIDDRVS